MSSAPGPAGPLENLPRLTLREVRLEQRLRRLTARLEKALAWLAEPLGGAIAIGPPDVRARASGLARGGVVVEAIWPSRAARLGLGLEPPLVHALVDRLLGFDRRPGEERLQVSPVESGILTLVAVRTLSELVGDGRHPDLVLDRVGPEPFDPAGLGPILTVRWPIQVGPTAGLARLWLPATLDLGEPSATHHAAAAEILRRFGTLTTTWRAVAGMATLPRGLARLRAGAVLPFDGTPPRGSPASPELPVRLRADAEWWFEADPVPGSGGGRLTLLSPLVHEPLPREPLSMSEPSPLPPADVPVTLVVELGRINLPLHRLADLKPGDVLELGRHAREPVELTSNGRLVARGELVQIDTELGVRVTNVLM